VALSQLTRWASANATRSTASTCQTACAVVARARRVAGRRRRGRVNPACCSHRWMVRTWGSATVGHLRARVARISPAPQVG
jgi:hypothetical protein